MVKFVCNLCSVAVFEQSILRRRVYPLTMSIDFPKGLVRMKFLRCFAFLMLFMIGIHPSTKAQNLSHSSLEPKVGEIKTRWQLGVFAAGGFPPNYYIRSRTQAYFNLPPAPGFGEGPFSTSVAEKLRIYNLGAEIGLMNRHRHLNWIARGRGEWLAEAIPLWIASYPKQTIGIRLKDSSGRVVPGLFQSTVIPQKSFYGSSVTPWLMRWNFSQRDSDRIVPWVQMGGGLLWTNHKFPIVGVPGNSILAFIVDPINRGGSSVINFTPQVGAGINVFTRSNRSVNLAVKAVHISNASLGDNNPGLNVTLQFSAGYSWWK